MGGHRLQRADIVIRSRKHQAAGGKHREAGEKNCGIAIPPAPHRDIAAKEVPPDEGLTPESLREERVPGENRGTGRREPRDTENPELAEPRERRDKKRGVCETRCPKCLKHRGGKCLQGIEG